MRGLMLLSGEEFGATFEEPMVRVLAVSPPFDFWPYWPPPTRPESRVRADGLSEPPNEPRNLKPVCLGGVAA